MTMTIGTAPVSIDDLLAVVDGEQVELDGSALSAIAAGCQVVEQELGAGTAVYGLTTQVGHGKDTRLSDDEIRGAQEFLVMSHAGGLGPPLPARSVRAAMAVRLVGLARGGSGASVAVAQTLAALLNAGVHPVVPRTGSVGAADLAQMAWIAQVAIGRGRAELDGDVLPGSEALRRAGIDPLVLGGKDGLALISANGFSVGRAALVVSEAARVAEAADLAAAVSMEAVQANPSILHPAVGRAKGVAGQVEAADNLRSLLSGSALLGPDGARSVQDALSFRVVPQVHGALRHYVAAARTAVEVELNAAADNPLVSVEDRALISNGNFHPMVLALACDALRIALAHVGQLSERRMAHLWDEFFRPQDSPPTSTYGLQLRYPAAAVVAELKQQAAPATLDVPPLDLGVEDHATGAPLSVDRTGASLDLLADLLAIELLMAAETLARSAGTRTLGTGTGAALDMVGDAIRSAEPYPDAVLGAVRARFPGARPAG